MAIVGCKICDAAMNANDSGLCTDCLRIRSLVTPISEALCDIRKELRETKIMLAKQKYPLIRVDK